MTHTHTHQTLRLPRHTMLNIISCRSIGVRCGCIKHPLSCHVSNGHGGEAGRVPKERLSGQRDVLLLCAVLRFRSEHQSESHTHRLFTT